jgi:hypothetical protein
LQDSNTNISAVFKVIKYSPERKAEWDSFCASAKNATFLFQRDFMDYHSHRFEDFSLMAYKEDTLVAVMPANRKGEMVCSHQGLTYGGFVLQDNTKLFDAFDAFKGMLKFLNSEAVETLDIRVIPSFYNVMPSDELEYFLFKAGAHLRKRDVLMVIDYAHKLRFQKNRREGINKARRNGLEVRIDQNYEQFWNEILIPNLAQKHQVSPVHSLKEIKLLASRFPNHIKQVSVYNKEGKLVAGTTVFLTKTTIHPQYISGNPDKNFYGSLDLAYDFIINHFRDDKRYFDFNISSEEDGTILNEGLIFWKETCGARTWVADNYLLNTTSYKDLNLKRK